MRQVRMYLDSVQLRANEISDPDIIRRIVKVMRLSKGGRILLFDGSGNEYDAEITGVEKKNINFRILKTTAGLGFEKDITLYMSLVKKDNFEIIAQKATELGVRKIVPVISQFCVKNEFSSKGLARLRTIINEAVEQSEGALVPEIVEPVQFEEALAMLPTSGISLMAQPRNVGKKLSEIQVKGPLSVFIGPEGGYSPEEVKMAAEHGIILVSLGDRILRAETAAIAMLGRLLIE